MNHLFNLKSMFYFLKNLVFAIFCFLAGFLIGSGLISAKALTVYNYGYLYEKFEKNDYNFQFNDQTVNVKDDVERLNDTLKNSGMNYIVIFETGNPSYSKFQPKLYVTEYIGNSTTFEKNSNDGSEWYTFGRSNTSGYVCLSSTNSNEFHSGIEELIEYINTNKHIPKTNLSYVKYDSGRYFNVLTADSSKNINGHFFMYDTNMTVKMTNLYDNEFMINGNIYKLNSILPTYRSIYGKTIYTFNEDVSTLGNGQIRFDFDVPFGERFDFYFNYSVTYGIGYESAPYLKYTTSNRSNILPLDKKFSDIAETVYADTQINPFNDNLTSLSFVVDLEGLRAKDEKVHIFFESEYPFTYRYVTDTTYKEVDWSGNYGIMLIPILYRENDLYYNDVYSDLFFKGDNLILKIFPDYYTDLVPIEEYTFKNYNSVFGSFKYYFRSSNQIYNMFFINEDYLTNNKATILKYDERYFVYSICKTSSSCDSIHNPNTGEDVVIKPPSGNDDTEELDSIDKIYKYIDDFLNETKGLSAYFNQMFYNFFSNMPDWFQTSCIFVYLMINVFLIIRMGGFNKDG